MGRGLEKHKHGEILPCTIRAIICSSSNCGKTNVLISVIEGRTAYVSITFTSTSNRCNEIAAAKVSISWKFIYVYWQNRLLYVLQQQRHRSTERDASILFLSLITWYATSRMWWKNTFRWAAMRWLFLSLSDVCEGKHLNIWYATTRTCWFYSNRILPTWNTFIIITWIPTCHTTNFARCAVIVGKKIWISSDRQG